MEQSDFKNEIKAVDCATGNQLPENMDIALFRAIADGDEAAYKQLFLSYQQRMFSAAYRLTSSEEAANEILQEVFLKIWFRRDKLKAVKHPFSYLYRTLTNTIYDYARKTKNQRAIKKLALLESVAYINDTEEKLRDKERTALIQQAVARLSPQRKAVYKLRFEEGWHYENIAAKLHITPANARKTFAEAIRFIRNHIQRYGILLTPFLVHALF